MIKKYIFMALVQRLPSIHRLTHNVNLSIPQFPIVLQSPNKKMERWLYNHGSCKFYKLDTEKSVPPKRQNMQWYLLCQLIASHGTGNIKAVLWSGVFGIGCHRAWRFSTLEEHDRRIKTVRKSAG